MKRMHHPKYIFEIYELMCGNNDLAGAFSLSDDAITWELFEGYRITLGEEYIGIDRLLFGKLPDPFTHWHPQDKNELYADICRLGTKGNVTVIRRNFFGASVLYCGEKDKCNVHRKWLFGRYYYLYAK